ncbi:hypothetical protein AURDEDRAFT_166172 [Auricularia subglabra TFB-10046 SS5]|nr:hypothetical protein AURDEDRAFT_166172 [Auricularia subglabra TFB-10046 SS5]
MPPASNQLRTLRRKRPGIALRCVSDEEVFEAVQHLNRSQELAESITLLHVQAPHLDGPILPEWPEICDILASCTNLDHLTLSVHNSSELLVLLAAFETHTFHRLRHLNVETTDSIPAHECIQLLNLAPSLRSFDCLPSTKETFTDAYIARVRPLKLEVAFWSRKNAELLSLLLSRRWTARKVVIASPPGVFSSLCSIHWAQVGPLSVRDLTIITSPFGGDHTPFGPLALACRDLRRLELRGGGAKMDQVLQQVGPLSVRDLTIITSPFGGDHTPFGPLALACRDLRRLELRGGGAKMDQVLQQVLAHPDSHLQSLTLCYGLRGTGPQSWRPALALVPRIVGLRRLSVHIPTRYREAFSRDAAELRRFCRLRRVVFTTGEVRPR